jgi:hypothetical protein
MGNPRPYLTVNVLRLVMLKCDYDLGFENIMYGNNPYPSLYYPLKGE